MDSNRILDEEFSYIDTDADMSESILQLVGVMLRPLRGINLWFARELRTGHGDRRSLGSIG